MVTGLQTIRAQEAYAALSDDNKTLTFYYDDQKASRNGMSVGPFEASYYKGWFRQNEVITTVRFDASFASYTELTSTALWFSGCRNLTTIEGIKNLKTDNVTSMYAMFENCSSLTSLDVSRFNTSNVTNMRWMFNFCSGLTSLDLSNFNTGNVTDMGMMFQACSSLMTIYAGDGWSTGRVTDGRDMFFGCTSLVGGNGMTYDPAHTDQEYARIDKPGQPGYFTSTDSDSPSLPYAILSDDNKTLTFYYDNQISARNGMRVGVFSMPQDRGWDAHSGDITVVKFDASFANYTYLTSTAYLFNRCWNLTTIEGIKNLKTDNVTNMQRMFSGCSSLTSLDLSSFDTQKVTNMGSMFDGCSSLKSLNLSSFNTEKVSSMRYMFSGCSSLTSLDLSSFNTEKVTDMRYMFRGCSSLTSLDLSNFNTENLTDMGLMFDGCSSLKSLDLSNFDTRNVTDMSSMFYYCSKLKTIYVGAGWSLDNVKSSGNMFYNCTSLVGGNGTTYDASHIDKEYARIDKPGQPGYFTDKNAPKWGDANGDGNVDIADVVTVLNAMASGSQDSRFDINGDTRVDIADVVSVLNLMASR